MTKRAKRVAVGRFGPLTGPLNAASAAFATASLGHLVYLSPWWAAGVAVAGGLLHEAEAYRRRLPLFTLAHRAAMWAATGVWTWFGLAQGPYSVPLIASLVAGTGVAIVSAQAAAIHTQTLAEQEARRDRVRRRLGVCEDWEDRLERVCNIVGARAEALEDWVNPDPHRPGKTRKTGYSLQVLLPPGGKRWTDIKSRTLELAADADLDEGCGVQVRKGKSARRVILDITTVNVFAETIDMPADYSKRSINEPITIGMKADGALAQIMLRWFCGILIGQTGSGKSNMLTVLICQLLRCDDVLIFGIDPNGGKAFKPFLRPWLQAGREGRPAIEWVAPDGAEGDDERAWALVQFLISAIPRRAGAYEQLMAEHDDDKIPVSHKVPQILLITDETANLSRRVKAGLVELSNRSRSVSIRQLTCALRAIDKGGDGIPTDLLAQGRVRIGMDVQDDAELAYLFGWGNKTPKAEESKGTGTAFVGTGKEAPEQAKAQRALPSVAEEFARQTEHLRPEMDQPTVDADRAAWEGRWDWLGENPPATPTPATPRQSTAPPPASDASAAWERLGLPPFGQAQGPGGKSRMDVDAEFQRMAEEQLADVSPAPPNPHEAGVAVPPLLLHCQRTAGDALRVHMSTLADACGMTSRRLGELLRMAGIEPIGHPIEVGGRSGKGYEVAHLVSAMVEIASGARECPRQVWEAWPPKG